MLHSTRQTQEIDLHLEVSGQGLPILCLHGHPGSGASLRVFTDHLRDRFLTLAPDLRGYGSSQVRQAFTMQDHLSDLELLLQRYQVRECLVLGWSLGGILAMELALSQPQTVKGLILVATSACPRSSHPPTSWQDDAYTGLASLINYLIPGWPWNIRTFGQRSLYRYLLQRHTPQAYRYLADYALTAYLRTSRRATAALRSALQQRYDRLADLSQIRCPSLMLIGEQDCHITLESSLATAACLPNCQVHIYPQTAHLLPWEIPQEICQDLDRWLQSQHFC